MSRRPSILALLALVAALVLASCAIGPDDAPRDIESPSATTVAAPAGSAASASGAGRIYLLAPDVPGLPTRLQAVARDVPDDATAVLSALLAGPNNTERTDQLRTAIPAGIVLRSVNVRSTGLASIDLTSGVEALSGDVLIDAIAQIVYTASAVEGVTSVAITVEGRTSKWPGANGELRSTPLTVYDFPGFDPSSQPAFPGVPTGS